jgi:hypothetical protein
MYSFLSRKILKTFYLRSTETASFVEDQGITFVLYDAGECNALMPVFDILELSGLNYHILAFATSSRLINKYQNRTVALSDDIRKKTNALKWPRDQKLSEQEITKICTKLNTNYIVTGMVSTLQLQIAIALKARGAYVVGYHDSFSVIAHGGMTYSFLTHLDQLLVPSGAIAASVEGLRSDLNVQVVGQPSVETWRQMLEENSDAEKQKFLRDDRFTIVYVGGYGGNYAEAFELFLDSVEELREKRILISLHPKVDGEFEGKLLSKKQCSHIEVLPKGVSTISAVLSSDLVVTHCSTVGVQAIFIEKPVLFFDVPGSKFSNVAIENGWAQQVFSKEEFLKVLAAGFDDSSVDLSGIPEKASSLIFNSIQAKAKSRIFTPLEKKLSLDNLFDK